MISVFWCIHFSVFLFYFQLHQSIFFVFLLCISVFLYVEVSCVMLVFVFSSCLHVFVYYNHHYHYHHQHLYLPLKPVYLYSCVYHPYHHHQHFYFSPKPCLCPSFRVCRPAPAVPYSPQECGSARGGRRVSGVCRGSPEGQGTMDQGRLCAG